MKKHIKLNRTYRASNEEEKKIKQNYKASEAYKQGITFSRWKVAKLLE